MGRLLSALFFVALLPASAPADPSCFGLCSVDCVKPISIPDRWDDFSVPGSTGWSGNGVWDSEKFTDVNGNGIWDPGEPFTDGSSAWTKGGAGPLNGQYDAETYDPLTTGYVVSADLGRQVVLVMSSPTLPDRIPCYPLDVPAPGVGGTETTRYSYNWTNCNPTIVTIGDLLPLTSGIVKGPTTVAVRDRINGDPGAYWDDGCLCPISSMGDQSPRLFVLTALDPRIPLNPGGLSVKVTKLIGFFVESVNTNADIQGRFAQVHRTGDNSCANGGDFIVDCAVPTKPTTWGGLKATYR